MLPLVKLVCSTSQFSIRITSFSGSLTISTLSLMVMSLSLTCGVGLRGSRGSNREVKLVVPVLILDLFTIVAGLDTTPLLLVTNCVLVRRVELNRGCSVVCLVSFSKLTFVPRLVHGFVLSKCLVCPITDSK